MDFTEIVLLGIAIVALVLEVVAMVGRRLGWYWVRLISPVMQHDGRIWLFWPWGWGVLAGHWWWPWAAPEGAWRYLIAATLGLVVLDVGFYRSEQATPKWAPFAALVAGLVAGAAFWAMGY
jgi:hypothetical protein